MKKTLIQIGLFVLVVILGYLLYRQFATPMEFQKTRSQREAAVVERLKDIRLAQRAYRQAYARFTPSMDSLIQFVMADSLTYERAIGSADDSLAVARGQVTREAFKVAVRDTVFARRKLTDADIRNFQYIPHGDGKKIAMDAGTLETGSGVIVQVFEAKVPYKEFLGEEEYEQELINLIDQQKTINKYPGLKVGSMTEATNEAGNWE